MVDDLVSEATPRLPLVLHTRVVSQTGGGPDKTILNSPRFMHQHGFDGICAFMRHPNDDGFTELEELARRWQAPILSVEDRGPFDWRIADRFREICRRHGPRIWHSHDYKSNLLGLMTRRSHPMALITTVHGWVRKTWKTPLYYAIDRYSLRFYDLVLCVSQDLLDSCLAHGVAPERCRLVVNAIDTDEYRRSEPATEAKKSAGVDPQRLVIGAVGRLSGEKGFDLLIRAVNRLRNEGTELELWIVGEGSARTQLEALIRELEIADRVKLLGYRSAMLEAYHCLDVLAISSLREGTPNALLEAMAFELPVLGTRSGGIAGVIKHQENGLLADPGSVDALADGLRRLARDPDLRRRLGEAARKTVERSFSFQDRMRKICSIYHEALTKADSA